MPYRSCTYILLPPSVCTRHIKLILPGINRGNAIWRTNEPPSSRGFRREEPVQRLPHLAVRTLATVCFILIKVRYLLLTPVLGSKASSPTETPKSQIDFQFLNFSHPSDAKGSRARRTVRSHVTRQQHQREHAAAAARRAKTFPQTDAEPDEASSSTAHSSSIATERPTTLELPRRPHLAASSTETSASSPSPSPTESPVYRPHRRIDPSDVYPEEWHPYLPHIMVSDKTQILHQA